LYFLVDNNQKVVAVNQTQRGETAKSAELFVPSRMDKNIVLRKNNFEKKEPKITVSEATKPTSKEELMAIVQVPNFIENASIEHEISKHPLPATTIIAADSPFEKTIEMPKFEANTIDNQPFVETPKHERTVILDIPDSEEFQRFQKVEKKNFFARLFRQVGKFNTEGKVDWTELNVKPNKVWAYMKDSVKNENVK
jgi:hypothetical protein